MSSQRIFAGEGCTSAKVAEESAAEEGVLGAGAQHSLHALCQRARVPHQWLHRARLRQHGTHKQLIYDRARRFERKCP